MSPSRAASSPRRASPPSRSAPSMPRTMSARWFASASRRRRRCSTKRSTVSPASPRSWRPEGGREPFGRPARPIRQGSARGGKPMDTPKGPDFTQGVPVADLADGQMLAGHCSGEAVVLIRRGAEFFAIEAACTHYGGPLGNGLLVGETVRCPWHHACFSIRTGEALRAPALDSLAVWKVERDGDRLVVREKAAPPAPPSIPSDKAPRSVVIVGGGAAGNAAAEMLRRKGYGGEVTMLSADADRPVDRPNLSKGFLAGKSPDSANPLRSPEFYREHKIDLRLNARVAAIDTGAREVRTEDGGRHPYGALLIATGAEPVKLDIPGAGLPHVHYLRTH